LISFIFFFFSSFHEFFPHTQERAAPHTQLLPNPTDWAVFESRRISIPPLLLGMLSDMSNALHSLHKKGIVHRDLKPQNVLLTESKQVKLSDMGLSKQLLAEQSSFDGTGLGSPGWQAPEVLLQKQKYLQGQHSIKSSSSSAAPQQFRITTIKESEKENTDASDGSASSLVDSANCSTAGSIKANTGIRHTRAVDVFSLGCVICYTLTREHPFGTIIDRDRNILLGKYDLKAFRAMKVEASATSTSDRDSRGDDAVKEEDKVEQGKLEEGKEANPAEQEQAEIVKPLDSTNREAQEEEDDKKEKDDEGNDASGDASEGESKDSPVVEEEAKPEAEAKAEPPSASLQKPTDSQIDAKKSNSSSTSWKKSKLELLAYINYFEAENLVEAMLHTDPRKRPSMDAVIAHPFWWSAEKRISFISDFSHRMENEDRATDPRLIGLLEMYSWQGLNKRAWNKQIDTVLWDESKKFRNYSVDSLRDLIRFIRNKVSHFRDNSPEIKVLLGSMPDGLYNYFGSRFPRLLMALYSFTIMYLRTEPLLQKYFPDGLSAEQMSCFLLPQGEPLKPTGMETGVFVEQEAPSRPGEEVCQHYKQTGFCRYGSQCKFDHPAEFRVEKNSIGLPVRPDAPECDYFARQGICKYGQSCRFNHPEKYIRKKKSSVSKETTMATAEGSDATTPQQLPQQSGGGELTNHNQRRPSTERGERERQTSSHATTDRYNNHSNNSSRSRQTDSYGSRGPRGSQSSRKIYRSDAPGRW
jgi:serine/threonine protein kinase